MPVPDGVPASVRTPSHESDFSVSKGSADPLSRVRGYRLRTFTCCSQTAPRLNSLHVAIAPPLSLRPTLLRNRGPVKIEAPPSRPGFRAPGVCSGPDAPQVRVSAHGLGLPGRPLARDYLPTLPAHNFAGPSGGKGEFHDCDQRPSGRIGR